MTIRMERVAQEVALAALCTAAAPDTPLEHAAPVATAFFGWDKKTDSSLSSADSEKSHTAAVCGDAILTSEAAVLLPDIPGVF